MKSSYSRLGDYIEEVEERNKNLSIKLSQGICNLKYFQNPRQVAENSSADKIVRRGWFAYNRATTRNGDKISIAYRDQEDCTVSASYLTFRIKDENILNPYYLMMWFKRPEFDRYARFKSHGSAHEYFEWEEMCNVTLPVPDIEVQRKIVAEYQAIEQRIENNRRLIATLEATAQTIYRKMFVDDIGTENLPEGWRMGKLGEIATFKNGKVIQPIGGNFPVYGGNGVVGFHNSHNAANVIVIGRVGANCGNIQIEQGKCWINDNAMMAASNDSTLYYLYWLLNTLSLNSKSEGSSQPLLTQTILTQIDCVIPDSNTIIRFDKIAKTNENEIIQKRRENQILIQLQSLLLSQLSNL